MVNCVFRSKDLAIDGFPKKSYVIFVTCVRGITSSAFDRFGKVMGSRLGWGTMAVDGAIARP